MTESVKLCVCEHVDTYNRYISMLYLFHTYRYIHTYEIDIASICAYCTKRTKILYIECWCNRPYVIVVEQRWKITCQVARQTKLCWLPIARTRVPRDGRKMVECIYVLHLILLQRNQKQRAERIDCIDLTIAIALW